MNVCFASRRVEKCRYESRLLKDPDPMPDTTVQTPCFRILRNDTERVPGNVILIMAKVELVHLMGLSQIVMYGYMRGCACLYSMSI
jgi:hypothetical protein